MKTMIGLRTLSRVSDGTTSTVDSEQDHTPTIQSKS
jgi:hypothetical protein